jgi:transposase
MEKRRIVGIDLGIATSHTVVIADETAKVLLRRRCSPNVESLAKMEQAARQDLDDDTRLDVVMEPTGAAWLPVAVFFIERGHHVFRVSSQKAFDMRRYFSRHAKSNSIDAEALAKMAVVDPDGLMPLVLPDADHASLDRRVRAADQLGEVIARHKVRIRELARHVMPMLDSAIKYELSYADLLILETAADPRELVDVDAAELGKRVRTVSNGTKGIEHVEMWQEVARQAVELYGCSEAVAFTDIAAEIQSEIRLLQVAREEQKRHIKAREAAYVKADPEQLARSVFGIAKNGGPVLVAAMGDAKRFSNASTFKSFTGLSPKASETGNVDRKGQPISKAGSRRLRDQLVMSANTARMLDPQLAEIYYRQMTERGAHHTKAVCVVAAKLAERSWAVMARGEPYVVRDQDGNEVTREQAKQIIAEQFTVSEEVRRRTRSRKSKGKAPHQVLEGHVN